MKPQMTRTEFITLQTTIGQGTTSKDTSSKSTTFKPETQKSNTPIVTEHMTTFDKPIGK